MAKVSFGIVPADVRGKLGNVVYMRTRAGAVARQRVDPTQTATPARNAVKSAMGSVITAWFTGMTDQKRLAWSQYATLLNRSDVFGQRKRYDALRAFLAVNLRRAYAGLGLLVTPPVNAVVRGLLSLSVTASAASGGTFSITFTPSPLPANHRLWIWSTVSLQPGINNYQPWLRWIGMSNAAVASPYDPSVAWRNKFISAFAGDAIGWRVQVLNDTNGLVSPGMRYRSLVAP